jgi:uncharacterized protein YndB with AHSA1/START domain
MRRVEVRMETSSSPGQVIAAFTDAEMLRDWWQVERTLIVKAPGGTYTLAWAINEAGFGYISTGIIKEYDPGGALVIDNFLYLNPARPFFGPMSLTVTAKQNASGGSDVYLCQDGYQQGEDWDWYYEVVKQAWPVAMKTLKTYLEQK